MKTTSSNSSSQDSPSPSPSKRPTQDDSIPTKDQHRQQSQAEVLAMNLDHCVSVPREGSIGCKSSESTGLEEYGPGDQDTKATSEESAKSKPAFSSTVSGKSVDFIKAKPKPGLKKGRDSIAARSNGTSALHKPFRSPMRVLNSSNMSSSGSTGPTNMRGVATTQSHSSSSASHEAAALSPENAASLNRELPLKRAFSSSSSSSSSAPPKSAQKLKIGPGPRRPFRSPVMTSPPDQLCSGPLQNSHQYHQLLVGTTTSTTVGRMLQIQSLQSRITELQSSIRKARQVVQQQEKDDAPLKELIDKWRRASQEGAQVLLDKYMAQEQVFGGNTWDDDDSSEKSRVGQSRYVAGEGEAGGSPFDSDWGWGSKDARVTDRRTADDVWNESPLARRERIETMEQQMETQDVLQDLPTVEEAMRSRTWPEDSEKEVAMQQKKSMTKMQRLLMGLGINPAVIGYDAEQDAFTDEDMPYESI